MARMAWANYKNNKYSNKKVEVDGIIFDSKREAKRYQELLLLEKAGAITNLQRQVKYVLIPTQREPDTVGARGGIHKGKVIEKECAYYADYTYIDSEGTLHVEDVKGYKGGAAYAVFAIKRKLMLYIYGIIVREI